MNDRINQSLISLKKSSFRSKWHGIEKARALNEVEINYVVALIMGWIEGQLD
jgi:hypothetical protein